MITSLILQKPHLFNTFIHGSEAGSTAQRTPEELFGELQKVLISKAWHFARSENICYELLYMEVFLKWGYPIIKYIFHYISYSHSHTLIYVSDTEKRTEQNIANPKYMHSNIYIILYTGSLTFINIFFCKKNKLQIASYSVKNTYHYPQV